MMIDPNKVPASGCMELVNAIWDHLDNSRKICNFISDIYRWCCNELAQYVYFFIILPAIASASDSVNLAANPEKPCL